MPQQDQIGKGPKTERKLGPCGNGISKSKGINYGLRKTGQGKQWTRRKRSTRKP